MSIKDFEITQDLIMGLSVPLVCAKYDVPVEEVVDLINTSPHFTTLTPHLRKQIALARLDACAAATMAKAAEGDVTAINTYLKIQEREAKLAGLDSQTDEKPIVINIPWLTQDRLSYKNKAVEVVQEVPEVQDVVPRAIESPTVPPTTDGSWKPAEPAPTGVNTLIHSLKHPN